MSNLLNLVGGLIPKQSYTVGAKKTASASSGLPVELTIKIDPDLKKTIVKGASILAVGALGAVLLDHGLKQIEKRSR